ncbi:Gmad2 immunoglobulin-like domain-containing protein [Solirubrobacter soli]|uniref:Gmad2 immunoglobulin-like domain-containing protein n=1 Tax=Solirubrobacter soli TaxID=363832 RepID=UPI0004284058|nr:Gmad2 immunoglobulin-like domain-containing protein [Solirubrobacter soli]
MLVALLGTAACALTATGAPASGRTVNLTALRVRTADHPAAVRVVVDFTDGRLDGNDGEVTDPVPFDGSAIVVVRHRAIENRAANVNADGVRTTIAQGTDKLTIRLRSDAGRFKYIAYSQLRSPERGVIDLYKSAPPSPAAEIRQSADGCLALRSWRVSGERVLVSGNARDIFENQFVTIVRDRVGHVIGHRPVSFGASGAWSSTIRYRSSRVQPATLEAVDDSERDGSLACLAQVRVQLQRTK